MNDSLALTFESSPYNCYAGVTAQKFVESPKIGPDTTSYGQSHYDMLRSLIAKKLDIPVKNVDIFTVRDHPTIPNTVDIRYSAHGSPYYRPSRIDGLMNEDKQEVSLTLSLSTVFFKHVSYSIASCLIKL